MTQPFVRAAIFAILSLILLAALSVVVFLFAIGMPNGPGGMAAFQAQAAQMAPTVDLILGGLLMLLCGWLAARPFSGRDALKTGALVGIIYILIDVAIVLVFGNADQMSIGTTGVSYIVKLAAAMIGGLIAGRTVYAPAEPVADAGAPADPVSLDKE